LEEGTRKHYDLNKLAMQLVKPGGLMLSCTCAGLLTQEVFDQMLHSAARTFIPLAGDVGANVRSVKIIRRIGAASDHPIGIHCPETEYFKSTWMVIE
jgi:23S rRNA (cytosine1962-C5)-methyltransferase